jgi:transcriptional regulator with GAF, ATPase, and Fis domain
MDGASVVPTTVEPGPGDERLRFERLIADLSAGFVNLPAAKVGAHIEGALRSITEFLDMDRGFLIEVREGSDELPVTWRFIGNLPLLGHRFAVHQYPWYAGRVRAGQPIVLPRLPEDLPRDSHEARRTFAELQIKTSVTVPVKIGGIVLGAICFCSHRANRDWSDELVQRLIVVGEIFASALERKRLDELLSQRLEFEALLTEVSSSLTHVPAEQVDTAIEAGLSRLATFLEVDRASLYEVWPDGSVSPTHSSASSIDAGPPVPAKTDALPFCMRALRRGEPVRIARVDALPADAAADRGALEAMGIGAALMIPVHARLELVCALGLAMSRPGRDWPEAMIPRLRLIAETFANAVARKRADQKLGQALSEVRQLKDRLAAENVYLQEQIGRESGSREIIGQSDGLGSVLLQLEQVAATGASVLLLGETGTGKSLVARAIHARSPRKDRPLITVNCAALPANLVESELFGHERGAFTGALTRRPGRFELADGGTLFLDEIGDLPLDLQAKLLRVLQDGEFERVGGSRTLRVNVRIIASTNRDLRADVQRGRFRQDLYYRLNVFPISMPALRQRRDDIPILVQHLVTRFAREMGRPIETVPTRVMSALVAYDWPGNVRELENVIERAVIISAGPALQLAEPLELHGGGAGGPDSAVDERLVGVERQHIVTILERTGWTIEGAKGAAAILGLNASTLRSRMQRLGIKRS